MVGFFKGSSPLSSYSSVLSIKMKKHWSRFQLFLPEISIISNIEDLLTFYYFQVAITATQLLCRFDVVEKTKG